MNKPQRSFPRPLAELLGATLAGAFKAQGFANAEIVARWAEIAGSDIAAHSEPMKISWPRVKGHDTPPEPATLVLRVEGPAALEIQHLSPIIIERVNRYFGWQAIGSIGLRQAPVSRHHKRAQPSPPDPAVAASIAGELGDIADENLRQALGRLGAAIKRK